MQDAKGGVVPVWFVAKLTGGLLFQAFAFF